MGERVEHRGVVHCLQTGNLNTHIGILGAGAHHGCGNPRHVHIRQVRDGTGGKGPNRQTRCFPQSDTAPAEVRLEPQPQLPERDKENDSLQRHAQSCRSGEENRLHRRPAFDRVAWRIDGCILRPEGENKDKERSDSNDVIEHGRPHESPEGLFRVEYLPNDRIKPVEEDLRQTPEREYIPEFFLLWRPCRAHNVNNRDGARQRNRCNQTDGRHRNGHELGNIPFAAVLGFSGFDNLRHEHGVEHTTGDQHVDEVGERICGLEDVTYGREGTQCHREKDCLKEP